jgi:hypothetical protein
MKTAMIIALGGALGSLITIEKAGVLYYKPGPAN